MHASRAEIRKPSVSLHNQSRQASKGTPAATSAVFAAALLAVLLPLSTFRNLEGGAKVLGTAAIVGLLLLGAGLCVARFDSLLRNLRLFGLSSILMICGLVVVHLPSLGEREFGLAGATVLLQLMSCLVYCLGISTLQWNGVTRDMLSRSSIVFLVSALAGYFFLRQSDAYSFYFENANAFGGYLIYFLFFILAGSDRRVGDKVFVQALPICIGLLLLALSNARAAWMTALVVLVVYYWFPVLKRQRQKFSFFFSLVLTATVGFVFVYVSWIENPEVAQYNELVYQKTGKTLFSGRHAIWPELMELIRDKPWFGYGAGFHPSHELARDLSAHNLYLQITSQVGLVGLGMFVLLLKGIWNSLWHGRNHRVVQWVCAFLVGLTIHSVFQVSLTQNNLSLAMFQWTIVGIGLGVSGSQRAYDIQQRKLRTGASMRSSRVQVRSAA